MLFRKNVFVYFYPSLNQSRLFSRLLSTSSVGHPPELFTKDGPPPPKLSKSRTKKFKMSDKKLWMPQDFVPEHIKKLLDDKLDPSKTRLNYILAFIQIVRLLKTQKRTGWLDHKVPRGSVESISDHMYRMSVILMLITNEEINKDKCVKIAVIHDLAEALVGDITPFDGVDKPEKSRREFETMKYLKSIIAKYNPKAADEILELWLDYEEIRNIEARYVKDIDKFEMIQQAWDYEQQFGTKHKLDMFYKSRSSIKTPEIGELCDELLSQRNAWLATQPIEEDQEGELK